MPVIVLENLVKRYRSQARPAVRGVSLTVEKGEFVGLLGPNGAGKSTLIALICGLLAPSEGGLLINNMRFRGQARAIEQSIGLVPQEIALYPSLTLLQNLRYFGRMYGLSGKGLRERIDFALEMASLSEFAEQRIATFSSGMQRRANLVTGLLHDPEILILDEPTVGIDAQSRHAIFENLKMINGQGTTLLYATHYMEEAQHLCGRVVIINQGQILSEGAPAELIRAHPPAANLEELFLSLTGHALRDGA